MLGFVDWKWLIGCFGFQDDLSVRFNLSIFFFGCFIFERDFGLGLQFGILLYEISHKIKQSERLLG